MVTIGLFTLIVATVVFASPVYRKSVSQPGLVSLPDPTTFETHNGTKWHIDFIGDIQFTGPMGPKGLGGDKCRSSFLGGQHIWNCGDMMCGTEWQTCGFSMGTAFYGTSDPNTINASATTNIADYQFAAPAFYDPKPVAPQFTYGMDTSNVAEINSTTGIAYVWEITRGGKGSPYVDHGAGVVAVTLGATQPIATRTGPLMTGPDSVQLGLLAIMRADNYIYNYNQQGPTGNIIVGRVEASNAAFDASNYEFLTFASSTSSSPTWVSGIPAIADAAQYGMSTSESGGRFACEQYGSVFWNNYFEKYMLMCNLYMDNTYFYLADNPWGPWGTSYKLFDDNGWLGYGVSAHPSYSPDGNHKELYFSQGPNVELHTFKITFDY